MKVTSLYAANPAKLEALVQRKVDRWESSMEESVDGDGSFEETNYHAGQRAEDVEYGQEEVFENAVDTSQRSEEEDRRSQVSLRFVMQYKTCM